LQLPGEHNVVNALAATAAAIALDTGLDEIQAGLAATAPVAGRLQRFTAAGGWTVIDDSYNANPASAQAALEVLVTEPGEAWAVFGDMRELGEDSDQLHAELGQTARRLGVRRVFATGPRCRALVEAFGPGARHFPRRKPLIAALCADLQDQAETPVTCLVKGSRSMGMEAVVAAITDLPACEETA
jgi:UDP-N-acetylmuramoyl-tripeptide--D-alanyl-D-alanine ligase